MATEEALEKTAISYGQGEQKASQQGHSPLLMEQVLSWLSIHVPLSAEPCLPP